MSGIQIDMPPELVEMVAERAAELVAERMGDQHGEGYLDVAGAADYLACPTSRIYSLVSARRLPHHRDGSRLLFDRLELRAYVEAGGARRP